MATRWHKLTQGTKQLAAWLAVALLLVACNRSTPTPTPVPPAVATVTTAAATPAVSAPVTPTFTAGAPTPDSSPPGSATGGATQGAVFTSPRYSYTVVLPCCWLALPTPGTAIESALAELEAESDLPVWGDLDEKVEEHPTGAVLELIALLPDGENVTLPIAQVTVSVLPTYGLTLDDYLAATSAELNSIANTSVLTSYIEPTLGVGAFPASVIEYSAVPTPANSENADQTMAGLQVAFFGQDADTLIVLTFTTTRERFAELQPEFLHIVRTVTLIHSTV